MPVRCGYLGKNILGSDLGFDIEIVRGGGAFVCGEETALINSIQGNVGEPSGQVRFSYRERVMGTAYCNQQCRNLGKYSGRYQPWS